MVELLCVVPSMRVRGRGRRLECYSGICRNLFSFCSIIGTQVDPLSKVHAAFCARLGLDAGRVQFMVDGDVVNLSQSADDLDLENDDVIVCRKAISAVI